MNWIIEDGAFIWGRGDEYKVRLPLRVSRTRNFYMVLENYPYRSSVLMVKRTKIRNAKRGAFELFLMDLVLARHGVKTDGAS